jgi:hypothetical protein
MNTAHLDKSTNFATGNVQDILYIFGYVALMIVPPDGHGRHFSKWPPLETVFVNISVYKAYINPNLVSKCIFSRS